MFLYLVVGQGAVEKTPSLMDDNSMPSDSSVLSDHATEVVAVIRRPDEGITGLGTGDADGSVALPTMSDLSLYPSNQLGLPQCFPAASQAMVMGSSIEASTPTLLTLTNSLPGPTTTHAPAMIISPMQPPVLAVPPLPAMHANTCDSSRRAHVSQPPVLPSLLDRLSQPPQPVQNTIATGHRFAQPSTSLCQPSDPMASQPTDRPIRQRGKKCGTKKTRGGLRGGLVKQFGKPFWDIVDSITDEEYATLSVAQQDFITSKIADRKRELSKGQ